MYKRCRRLRFLERGESYKRGAWSKKEGMTPLTTYALDHKILLDKINGRNFSDQTIKWFHSYLTKRAFCISLDDLLSETKNINCRCLINTTWISETFLAGWLLHNILSVYFKKKLRLTRFWVFWLKCLSNINFSWPIFKWWKKYSSNWLEWVVYKPKRIHLEVICGPWYI